MIRLGVCAPLERAEAVKRRGFDYIEGNLTALCAMEERALAEVEDAMARARIKAEAFNCMLPASLAVVGPAVDEAALEAHLDRALARAARLGARVCVFGSGGARRVPEGFSGPESWRQVRRFLGLLEPRAAAHGLRVAVEPLRREECNLINLVSEATLLSAIADLPHVGVLADTYHMAASAEPLSSLSLAGPLLFHVHTAHPLSRAFPAPGDGADYLALFQALRAARYSGRVSVEGNSANFDADAGRAYEALASAREGS